MRIRKTWACVLAAAYTLTVLTATHAMAGQDAIRIDMTEGNRDAWANIAMANDDTVETGVNIREAADMNSKVSGFLYRGGAVYVLNKGETWSEVTSGKVTGYIRNEYLTFGEEAKGLAEYYGSYGVKASWNDVHIFSGESGDAKIIRTAGDGDTFRLVGKNGRWMQLVAGEGQTAYVPAEDVALVMVVDSAVAVDEEDDGSSSVFTPVDASAAEAKSSRSSSAKESPEVSSGSDAPAEDQAAGQEVYDTPAEEYAAPAYEESYPDSGSGYDAAGSEASAPEAVSAPEEASVPTAAAAPTVSETPINTQGSVEELKAQANELYQKYLTAQAAADAAVANGADEQTILDTAAAAVAAYSTYVKAQNLADEASWGVPVETAQTADTSTSQSTVQEPAEVQPAASEPTESYSVDDYTEDEFEDDEYDDDGYEDDGYTDTTYEDTTTSEETQATSQTSVSDLELLAALIYCEAEEAQALKQSGGFEISCYEDFEQQMNRFIDDETYLKAQGQLAGQYVKGKAGATWHVLSSVF